MRNAYEEKEKKISSSGVINLHFLFSFDPKRIQYRCCFIINRQFKMIEIPTNLKSTQFLLSILLQSTGHLPLHDNP